jgi:hypothetical protein
MTLHNTGSLTTATELVDYTYENNKFFCFSEKKHE